jgi:uncharacterized membrane protein YedE/YeeE
MRSSAQYLVALVSGLLFGVGLALSEMINPRRVLAFLDVLGDWDPTLAFVMIGAIPISALAYVMLRGRQSPAFDTKFRIPDRTDINARLIAGALLFGIGWGIGGYCPGPIVAMLSLQWREPVVFLTAFLAGSQLCSYLEQKNT